MLTVGIIGKIGSGKSLLCGYLSSRGFPCIYADQVGHNLLDDPYIQERLSALLGSSILSADGKIDRALIAHQVFKKPIKRKKLNALIHPKMVEKIVARIESYRESGEQAVFVEAAIMKEMGLVDYMDHILLISAPLLLRQERELKMRGLSASEVLARDQVQDIDLAEFDVPMSILVNNGTIDQLYEKADAFLEKIGIRPLFK